MFATVDVCEADIKTKQRHSRKMHSYVHHQKSNHQIGINKYSHSLL